MALNVKDPPYNAKGDGSTDDTTAINAAIVAANLSGGHTVFVPKGTYICSRAISLADTRFIRLTGEGPSVSVLRFTNTVADHGVDLTGADHCHVEDLGILSVGGTPLAGLLLGRSLVRDGGNGYFKRLQIEGNFPVGIYSYGSELNSYWHCNVIVPGVALFVTATNPLGYLSRNTSIKTGGQSNTYGSWHHGQLASLAAAPAPYDATLVLDTAASWSFVHPIIGTRAQGVSSNVLLRGASGATQNIQFVGTHLENLGATAFLVDTGGTNNLTILGGWFATPTTTSRIVGKHPVNGGAVSGLTLLGCGSYGGTAYQMLDLDSAVDVLVQLGGARWTPPLRFSGLVVGNYP